MKFEHLPFVGKILIFMEILETNLLKTFLFLKCVVNNEGNINSRSENGQAMKCKTVQ